MVVTDKSDNLMKICRFTCHQISANLNRT